MKAVYPGTFDPITNGHIDVIVRGSKVFSEVIVAIAMSERKSPLFTFEDRVAVCEEALAQYTNVKVKPFTGLIVEFAKSEQARALLRGLRSVTDFDYELSQFGLNRTMAPEIETVYLAASPNTAFISSTIVREIIAVGGDASPFVPKAVLKKLK